MELADRTVKWFEAKTSDWRQDPRQAYVYGSFLSRAERWDEAQAVLEDLLKVDPKLFAPR